MMPSNTEDMTGTDATSAEAEMAKYGIKRIPVDYFHFQEFRYTSLKEAVAQAKKASAAQ